MSPSLPLFEIARSRSFEEKLFVIKKKTASVVRDKAGFRGLLAAVRDTKVGCGGGRRLLANTQ